MGQGTRNENVKDLQPTANIVVWSEALKGAPNKDYRTLTVTHRSARYRSMAKCPLWGGLKEPAKTTVVFSLVAVLLGGSGQGYDIMLGRRIGPTSVTTQNKRPELAAAATPHCQRLLLLSLQLIVLKQ